MSRNSAATVYGGAGGRDSRASVTSLEGLRNVMRNDTERDSGPVSAAAPETQAPSPAPAAPVVPADDKQTLRGLNKRLQDYLDKVNQLQAENEDLEKEIDDILKKREKPQGRDWDEVQAPLDDLRQKIKDITMDNAKLLLENDNTKMATDDLKDKLDDEKKAQKVLEKDLDDLNKILDNAKLNQENTKKMIELVKKDLDHLQKEHKDIVDDLCEKIRRSEVKVEIDSQNSNLSDIINKIRSQYDKIAEKNLKEMEDWYQSKFDNMKVAEAQNTEAFQTGKVELKNVLKDKRTFEISIHTSLNTIRNLEETLNNAKVENDRRLLPVNKMLLNLEAELKRVRSQVEHQAQLNKDLVSVKMRLEAEIKQYQDLMAGNDSMETAGTVKSDKKEPENKGPKQLEKVKEEPPVKQ